MVKAEDGGGRGGWRWANGGEEGDTCNYVNIKKIFKKKRENGDLRMFQ